MKADKIIQQEHFSREDIIFLLGLSESARIETLLKKSSQIRDKYFGKDIQIRGVIKFSNYCSRNCLYCGLREDNFTIRRYRLSTDEILCAARKIYEKGVRRIFLESGHDSFYDSDIISYLIYSIKKEFNVAVTLSIGERSFDDYKSWKIAGASGYFLKYESANLSAQNGYSSVSTYEERINHIKYLKTLGYEVGSGIIIGLPKQEPGNIADELILSRDLKTDIFSVAPFVPANFTPYQNYNSGDISLTLKTIAVARLLLQNCHITSSASLDLLDKKGRERGILAGADLIYNNFTPVPYSGLYRAHTDKSGVKKNPLDTHEIIKARIESTGSRSI